MLPLEVGNEWTYESADGEGRFTISVGIPEIHDGRVYYSLRGYGYGPKEAKLLVRAGDGGNLFTWDTDHGADAILTSFEHVPGGRFDSRLGPCETLGKVAGQRTSWKLGSQVQAAALAITYETLGCADLGLERELYVENIGLVERVIITLAGPRQYRLTYARVGGLVYRARASSSLSLEVDTAAFTLDAEGNHPPATVTLRYAVEPLAAGTLQFRSAQIYDFFLVDSNGNEVWRWSGDTAFTQPLIDVQFSGMIEFREQFPVQRFAPGAYMLYGTLNTNSLVQPTVGMAIQIVEAQTVSVETLRRSGARRRVAIQGK